MSNSHFRKTYISENEPEHVTQNQNYIKWMKHLDVEIELLLSPNRSFI